MLTPIKIDADELKGWLVECVNPREKYMAYTVVTSILILQVKVCIGGSWRPTITECLEAFSNSTKDLQFNIYPESTIIVIRQVRTF